MHIYDGNNNDGRRTSIKTEKEKKYEGEMEKQPKKKRIQRQNGTIEKQ